MIDLRLLDKYLSLMCSHYFLKPQLFNGRLKKKHVHYLTKNKFVSGFWGPIPN